jgi:hypothetical protein
VTIAPMPNALRTYFVFRLCAVTTKSTACEAHSAVPARLALVFS